MFVGFLVTHHYEFMLHKQLRDPYHHLLTHEDVPTRMCCQVLRNLQTYLVEEELKMMKADAECMCTIFLINSLALQALLKDRMCTLVSIII